MKKLVLVSIMAGLLVGCAQEPLKKQTASGKPEAEFPTYSVKQVMNGLVGMCNSSGLMIDSQADNYIVCSKTLEGGQALLTQMAIGNSYSTTPQNKVRFSVSSFKNGTKVYADMWSETQMALGQVNKVPLEGNKAKNDIQKLLDEKLPQHISK